MNNPRIEELLKGCGKEWNDSLIYTYNCDKETLCSTCKAELIGILGQMKCEVEFLFSLKAQYENIKINKRIEELNSDIKRIEEKLK